MFYPYSIKVNKCSGSCSNINDPHTKLCFPNIIKNINVKVFNLMSRFNEARQIIWPKTCKCICRLTSAVCNSRQIWNEDKCRCECKQDLVNKMVYDKGYIWNPSNCACECDKSCGIGQYLDFTVTSSNDCDSCTPYVVLFAVFLSMGIIISGASVYFHWYKNKKLHLKKDVPDLTIQRLKH